MDPILKKLQTLRNQYKAKDISYSLDSRRVFHGRGRCYPGLEFVCVDFFQPVLFITFFNEPPVNWLEEFMSSAESLLSPVVSAVLVQHRYRQGAPTITVWGEMPAEVYAQRGALRFLLPIAQQQNSGYFLD